MPINGQHPKRWSHHAFFLSPNIMILELQSQPKYNKNQLQLVKSSMRLSNTQAYGEKRQTFYCLSTMHHHLTTIHNVQYIKTTLWFLDSFIDFISVMQWWVQIPFSMNENLFELYILVYKGKYDINMWKILRILTKPKSKIWKFKNLFNFWF